MSHGRNGLEERVLRMLRAAAPGVVTERWIERVTGCRSQEGVRLAIHRLRCKGHAIGRDRGVGWYLRGEA